MNYLAWPPLQSLAVKKCFIFLKILGGEKLLKFVEKCRCNIFKRPEMGLKTLRSRFGSFFGFFRVFQTVFRIDLKFCSGAISFCRHAALRTTTATKLRLSSFTIQWESAKVSHKRVFALLTPEIRSWKMAEMLQKTSVRAPGLSTHEREHPFV